MDRTRTGYPAFPVRSCIRDAAAGAWQSAREPRLPWRARHRASCTACPWSARGCAHRSCGPPFPRPLVPVVLQLFAQDLAAVAFRQLRDDEDLLRDFRRREVGLAMVRYGGFAQAMAGLGHHVAHDLLAVDLVRHADRGGIEHVGMLEQDLVDLERRDVHAPADDEVLGAAADPDEPILVHDREIAGFDARAADRLDGAVVAQVADGAVRAAGGYLALHVGRARFSSGIDDLQFLMQCGQSNRAHLAAVMPIAAQPAGL